MKKKGILLFLLVIVCGVFFYTYQHSITKLTEKNFKEMLVHQGSAGDSARYTLADVDKSSLFTALTSLADITDKNQPLTKQEYTLQLKNRWGVSWEYRIFYDENNHVYLNKQGSDTIYQIKSPDFFYHHQWFSEIYDDRMSPRIHLAVNEIEIPFSYQDHNWRFRRHDHAWVEQKFPASDSEVKSDQDAVLIKSIDNPITITTDKQPDNIHLVIRNHGDNRVVFEGDMLKSELPYPESNGHFDYVMTMDWGGAKPYQGQATILFTIMMDVPETFKVSSQQIIQGEILEIVISYADNPDDIFIEQSIFHDFRWYTHGQLLRGYIPTNYTKPGVYKVTYGNRIKGTEYTKEIEIKAHDYLIQHLTISSQVVKNTQNEAAYAEFRKYFVPVRKQSEPTRYYTEPFVVPAKGKLTSEFGQIRYYNHAPTPTRHSGLDIAAPTGTEIVATNRGRVVLSMFLMQTGNTIVIDHGEGLFSVYYHLHERTVERDIIVERGQKIGTIGTTGFSTGPHLHFTMSFYTMNIDPGFLLVGRPITFSNYRDYLK